MCLIHAFMSIQMYEYVIFLNHGIKNNPVAPYMKFTIYCVNSESCSKY